MNSFKLQSVCRVWFNMTSFLKKLIERYIGHVTECNYNNESVTWITGRKRQEGG